MARIRTIKPEFWQDEKLLPLSDTTRLVFLGLISLADDLGRLVYNPKLIEALLFDPDGPDRSRDVRESLANLSRIGRVIVGKAASGQRVLQIANWAKHQKVDKPNCAAALPEIVEVQAVTEFANDSRMIRDAFANDSRPIPTTNDLHTNDQRPGIAPRKRSAKPVDDDEDDAKKYPHFGQVERGRCIAAFRKVGEYPPGRVVKVLAPYFRPATDPTHIPHDKVAFAVEDYCGVIGRGFSARWVSPEDCAKKLLLMAKNCVQYEDDPFGRLDAQMVAVHGKAQVAA